MKRYKQSDPLWAKEKIGKSHLTIGSDGCALTGVAILHSKFYIDPINPSYAAKMFEYIQNGRDAGKILWNETVFPGMKFVWRGYWPENKLIKEYAQDPDKGIILEVNYNHWIAVEAWSILKLRVIDPLTGKSSWGLPKGYRITGYALFEKLEPIKMKQDKLPSIVLWNQKYNFVTKVSNPPTENEIRACYVVYKVMKRIAENKVDSIDYDLGKL